MTDHWAVEDPQTPVQKTDTYIKCTLHEHMCAHLSSHSHSKLMGFVNIKNLIIQNKGSTWIKNWKGIFHCLNFAGVGGVQPIQFAFGLLEFFYISQSGL